jgi:hypothetical protein
MKRCNTRREQDEIVCACGKRWDANDEPPACGDRRAYVSAPTKAPGVDNDRRWVALITAQIPVELPDHVAREMVRAFYAHPGEPVVAIKSAYRVFIDSLP